MRKIKYLFSFVLILFFISNSLAQQESTITNYWSHMNVINPAYVGSDNMVNWKSTIRNQWAGIPDAPQTQMFSFSSPLGKNVGIGMSIVNDKVFVESDGYIAVDFSYKLKVSEKADLYFGLKAGGQFYSVNAANLEVLDPLSDPSLGDADTSYPNMGLGFLLKKEKWFISLSSPRILKTEKIKIEEERVTAATDEPHLYISSGYRFDLKNDWSLTPSFLLSTVKDVPALFDFNLLTSYKDFISLGLTFRNSDTYAAVLSFDFAENFKIGYAYETRTRTLLANNLNTSEIFIGYSIPFKNKSGNEELLEEIAE